MRAVPSGFEAQYPPAAAIGVIASVKRAATRNLIQASEMPRLWICLGAVVRVGRGEPYGLLPRYRAGTQMGTGRINNLSRIKRFWIGPSSPFLGTSYAQAHDFAAMRLIDPRNRHTMAGHGVNGLSYGSLIGLTSLHLRPSGALQFRSDRC